MTTVKKMEFAYLTLQFETGWGGELMAYASARATISVRDALRHITGLPDEIIHPHLSRMARVVLKQHGWQPDRSSRGVLLRRPEAGAQVMVHSQGGMVQRWLSRNKEASRALVLEEVGRRIEGDRRRAARVVSREVWRAEVAAYLRGRSKAHINRFLIDGLGFSEFEIRRSDRDLARALFRENFWAPPAGRTQQPWRRMSEVEIAGGRIMRIVDELSNGLMQGDEPPCPAGLANAYLEAVQSSMRW